MKNYKQLVTSSALIRDLLKLRGYSLKKRYGQTFLYDRNIINRIIKYLNPSQNDIIVEVGPGIGNITLFYIERVNFAYLFEIDTGFVEILKKFLKDLKNYELLNIDFLKFDLNKILKPERKYKFFSSLPYSIGSKIIQKICENHHFWKEVNIIVPEAVYTRICASPGSKEYSRITLLVRFFYNIKEKLLIKPGSFYPKPEINSVYIKLIPHEKYINSVSFDKFQEAVKILFSFRRKQIGRILKNFSFPFFNPEKIEKVKTKRIEELMIDEIIDLLL